MGGEGDGLASLGAAADTGGGLDSKGVAAGGEGDGLASLGAAADTGGGLDSKVASGAEEDVGCMG